MGQPLVGGAQQAYICVAGHLDTAHLGHELRLLPAVKQIGADALRVRPNCRAAARVLRLSLARRRASALNDSSSLRSLSGDAPLVLVAIYRRNRRSSSVQLSQTTSNQSRYNRMSCSSHIMLIVNLHHNIQLVLKR